MPLSAGDMFGSYQLLAALGVGGMGEVWKALDPLLNGLVAIKHLKRAVNGRFVLEAHAIAALNHVLRIPAGVNPR